MCQPLFVLFRFNTWHHLVGILLLLPFFLQKLVEIDGIQRTGFAGLKNHVVNIQIVSFLFILLLLNEALPRHLSRQHSFVTFVLLQLKVEIVELLPNLVFHGRIPFKIVHGIEHFLLESCVLLHQKPLVIRSVALEMPSVSSCRVDLGADSLVHVIEHVRSTSANRW